MKRALTALMLLLGPLAVTGAPPPAAADPLIATTTTMTIDPPQTPHPVTLPITFHLHVSAAGGVVPTGSVFVGAGGCSNPPAASATLDADGNATAVIPSANLNINPYQFTGCYHGETGGIDDTFADSESATFEYPVVADATTTTMTIDPPQTPHPVTLPITFHLHVSAASGLVPSGSVYVGSGGCTNPAATSGTLDADGDATAVIPSANLNVNPYEFTACYKGETGGIDDRFADSESTAIQYPVVTDATTTTMTIDPPQTPHPITLPITFHLHVSASSGLVPTGSVYVGSGGCTNPAATSATLDANGDATAVIPSANLSVNPYSFTGCYHGETGAADDKFADSESATLEYPVVQDATTTTFTIDPPQSPHLVSVPITVHAHVTAASGLVPTGTVGFSTGPCYAIPHASATLDANGDATATIDDLHVNDYVFTACYLGDAGDAGDHFAPSESDSIDYDVVAEIVPVLATQASPGGDLGTVLTDTATVTGGQSPTGSVTFRLYSDAQCSTLVSSSTSALVGGQATSAPFTPTATGTYRWVASYGGDGTNSPVVGTCGDPTETAEVTGPVLPPVTRTVSGWVFGGVTVRKGESVLIDGATVLGSVTVQAGGAVRVVGSTITNGISSSGAKALDLCGTHVSASTAGAITITDSRGGVRIGAPADGCAGNRIDGDVTLLSNRSVTMLGNTVGGKVTVTGGGPGNTVIGGNSVSRLSCQSVRPAPIDLGQPNRGVRSGQCASL